MWQALANQLQRDHTVMRLSLEKEIIYTTVSLQVFSPKDRAGLLADAFDLAR